MSSATKSLISFVKTLGIAAFIAFFCIRGFVFEPFKIPSSSMMPTLLIGDYLIVTKFAYGNRFPLTDYFFWETDPKRGDIAVFKRDGSGLPGSFFGFGKTLFIKRIVGVPGDMIAYRNQTLFINGRVVTNEDKGVYDLQLPTGGMIKADLKEEDLLGVKHAILRNPAEPGPEVAETLVPEGMYVMMGDNRDNSRDSRYWQWPSWGFVPKSDIMGRAEFIFWSWDDNWVPRLNRIGNGLRAQVSSFERAGAEHGPWWDGCVSEAFAKRLGYSFQQPALLEQALTHPSFGADNYQRLEFLGDRVLGLVVANMLFTHFPEAAEGELSRRFTMLVREATLAEIGREWRLEGEVKLGVGETLKQAILADVVEAILGAMYEDGGLDVARGLVETAWKPYLELKDEKDPKSRLQEMVQGGGNPLPEYVVIAEEGPDHNKNFTVEVRSALGVGTGQGISKQVAGAAAAAALLAQLEK